MQEIDLPVFENFDAMNAAQLEEFKSKGFCYVRLPQDIYQVLKKVSTIARGYFQLDDSEKRKCQRNKSGEGYMDHQDKGDEYIQRYIFLGSKPPVPLLSVSNEMQLVRNFLENNIALPLLKQLFEFVQRR